MYKLTFPFSVAGSTVKTRKRKPSESEPAAKPRLFKENVENKQTRRKTINNRYSNKKKVLEEANNSKLREIEVRVEDCLQTNSALSLLCRQKLEEHTDRPPDPPDSVPIDEVVDPPSPPPPTDGVVEDTNGSSSSSGNSSVVELVSVINDDNGVSCEHVQCVESAVPTKDVVNEGGDNIISSNNSTGGSSEKDCVIIVAERTETPTNTPVGKASDQGQDCSIRGEDSKQYKGISQLFRFL